MTICLLSPSWSQRCQRQVLCLARSESEKRRGSLWRWRRLCCATIGLFRGELIMSLAHDLLIEALSSEGPACAELVERLGKVSTEGASRVLNVPLAWAVSRDCLLHAVATGYRSVMGSAGVQEKEDIRLCILKKAAYTAPFEPACIFPRIATARVSLLAACLA